MTISELRARALLLLSTSGDPCPEIDRQAWSAILVLCEHMADDEDSRDLDVIFRNGLAQD